MMDLTEEEIKRAVCIVHAIENAFLEQEIPTKIVLHAINTLLIVNTFEGDWTKQELLGFVSGAWEAMVAMNTPKKNHPH